MTLRASTSWFTHPSVITQFSNLYRLLSLYSPYLHIVYHCCPYFSYDLRGIQLVVLSYIHRTSFPNLYHLLSICSTQLRVDTTIVLVLSLALPRPTQHPLSSPHRIVHYHCWATTIFICTCIWGNTSKQSTASHCTTYALARIKYDKRESRIGEEGNVHLIMAWRIKKSSRLLTFLVITQMLPHIGLCRSSIPLHLSEHIGPGNRMLWPPTSSVRSNPTRGKEKRDERGNTRLPVVQTMELVYCRLLTLSVIICMSPPLNYEHPSLPLHFLGTLNQSTVSCGTTHVLRQVKTRDRKAGEDKKGNKCLTTMPRLEIVSYRSLTLSIIVWMSPSLDYYHLNLPLHFSRHDEPITRELWHHLCFGQVKTNERKSEKGERGNKRLMTMQKWSSFLVIYLPCLLLYACCLCQTSVILICLYNPQGASNKSTASFGTTYLFGWVKTNERKGERG